MGWQRVKTDSGYHLRLVAPNGEIVVTGEVLHNKADVQIALDAVRKSFAAALHTNISGGSITSVIKPTFLEDVDE
jgi:uncharacterized protein YegP (UPF0339 family)